MSLCRAPLVHVIVMAGLLICNATLARANERLNVLFISVDDMNYDSLGVTGCKVQGISPNLDKFASEVILFTKAHVTIAVCQPTRATWMTALYPHKNGARGFEKIKKGIPTLPEILRANGYYLGILGKVPHVVPSRGAAWHMALRAKELGLGRVPELYYKHAKQFFEKAKKQKQPFFLMANSHDPHRPFAGSDQEKGRKRKNQNKKKTKKQKPYPRVTDPYKPAEVTVPGFLPDIPEVRLEMSEYYTSVCRADAIVGAVLRALEESGMAENTIVIFLSDHGMPLPFAKTNCYYHSTRTPLMVRWPGVVTPKTIDRTHFVSGIDLTPTILDAIQLPAIKKADGRSFVPLLRGQRQKRRDTLFTVFHKTSGRRAYEMRATHDSQYIYIYNAWADGKTIFRNESQNGRTMRAMRKAADSNPKIAARVKLFLYRVPEELYDYKNDPDGRHNLINDPKHQRALTRLRLQAQQQMRELNDPVLKTYTNYLQSK
ncbi:MAG: sulfatase [Gemmataceae bacterium]